MLTLFLLFLLALFGIPFVIWICACALEVLPLAVGLLVCWFLFHAVGCL